MRKKLVSQTSLVYLICLSIIVSFLGWRVGTVPYLKRRGRDSVFFYPTFVFDMVLDGVRALAIAVKAREGLPALVALHLLSVVILGLSLAGFLYWDRLPMDS